MAYFNESFMENRRKQWLRSIVAVEARAFRESATTTDSLMCRGKIIEKKIEGDSLVIMATFPELDAEACTIDLTRIIDVRGEIAAISRTVVYKNSGQGFMVKITIPLYEVIA